MKTKQALVSSLSSVIIIYNQTLKVAKSARLRKQFTHACKHAFYNITHRQSGQIFTLIHVALARITGAFHPKV